MPEFQAFFLLSVSPRLPAVRLAAVAEPQRTTNSAVAPLQQKPGDLLDGFNRAVCYSGFRHGQHPDRGEGAVNPSDKEILEDLQLLSRHGFRFDPAV